MQTQTINRALRLKIIELYDSQTAFAKEVGVSNSLVSAVIRRGWRLDDTQYQRWVEKLGGYDFDERNGNLSTPK